MTDAVELFYARPAVNGIDICIQDDAGFRVHFLSHSQALHLGQSIISLIEIRGVQPHTKKVDK
jgi:hypothetical protein